MRNQILVLSKSDQHSLLKSMIAWSVCFLMLGLCLIQTVAAQDDIVLYESGFETDEGYVLGDLNQQQNWSVLNGSAEVQDRIIHSGENAAQLSADSHVQKQVSAVGKQVVMNSYLYAEQSQGSSPVGSTLSRQAIVGVDLSENNELMAFDGNGAGHGVWRSTGYVPTPGTWFQVSILIDFETKTWILSADGKRLLSNLGFNNNAIASIYQLDWNNRNTGEFYLDDLALSLHEPSEGEVPGDGEFIIGFEPEENFQLGNLDGQNNWLVLQGRAEVWDTIVHSGLQAARVAPMSGIQYQHPVFTGNNTVSMYLQAQPSEVPSLPDTNRSALIYYDQTRGIMGFDGDGNGGGEWVTSGVTPAPNTWFEISIQQDFDNKVWSASIDGQVVFESLGFHSNSVLTLSQVNIHSSQDTEVLVDAFQLASVTVETPILHWNIY